MPRASDTNVVELKQQLARRLAELEQLNAQREVTRKHIGRITRRLQSVQATRGVALPAGWDESNARRVELIDKELNGEWTQLEREELKELRLAMSRALDKVAPLPPRPIRRELSRSAKVG